VSDDLSDSDRGYRDFVGTQLESLRAMAYLTCGDWQLAEDAAVSALSRMYPQWKRVENPAFYARKAVIRAAIDETRRPWWRREESRSHEMPEPPQSDRTHLVDERLRLRDALQRLPVRLRAVLVLRFIENFSVRETAEALGCPEGTVKNYTSRGLDAMRREISDPLDDDSVGGRHGQPTARPARSR
jgi:RNA polymerase sigma-70 factor (sigma-E family)